MLKFGIIGNPLEHSLSPQMQTAALQYLNIFGEYKKYELDDKNFDKEFAELKKLELKGLNVTIPYKVKVMKYVDELTPNARLTGAVNTIIFKSDGTLIAENTDTTGFWNAIPDTIKNKVPNNEVSVIGNGGAARAVCISLLQNKVGAIKVYGRNKNKLDEFYETLNERIKDFGFTANILVSEMKDVNLFNSVMVVNTTPIGMHPNIDETPIDKKVLKILDKKSLVYDLIYNPEETKLLAEAKELGIETLNGGEMLVRQGAASLAHWLEQDVDPLGAMRLALNQTLEFTA